jgi:hypothetical protein
MEIGARAERPAHVLGHDTDVFSAGMEDLHEDLVQAVYALAPGDQRDASIAIVGERGARLHRAARDALIHELAAHHQGRDFQCAAHRGGVAQRAPEALGALERQHLVLHFHPLGRVARQKPGLGDHDGDRFADVPRLAARERPLRPLERVFERAPAQVERLQRVRHMLDRRKAIGGIVLAVEDGEHARTAGLADAHDARVRMRRAHESAPDLPREHHVVGKAPASREKPVVLETRDALADVHA